MKNVRLERINSEIAAAIQAIIDNNIRDPQIDALISVLHVDTTPDLAYSRVYITSMGNTPTAEIVARLKGAGGFIRGELSKKVKLRITPRLEFIQDTSMDKSQRIEDILKTIKYATESDDEE